MSKSIWVARAPPTWIVLIDEVGAAGGPSRRSRCASIVGVAPRAPGGPVGHPLGRREPVRVDVVQDDARRRAAPANDRMSPSRLRVNSTLPAPTSTIRGMPNLLTGGDLRGATTTGRTDVRMSHDTSVEGSRRKWVVHSRAAWVDPPRGRVDHPDMESEQREPSGIVPVGPVVPVRAPRAAPLIAIVAVLVGTAAFVVGLQLGGARPVEQRPAIVPSPPAASVASVARRRHRSPARPTRVRSPTRSDRPTCSRSSSAARAA